MDKNISFNLIHHLAKQKERLSLAQKQYLDKVASFSDGTLSTLCRSHSTLEQMDTHLNLSLDIVRTMFKNFVLNLVISENIHFKNHVDAWNEFAKRFPVVPDGKVARFDFIKYNNLENFERLYSLVCTFHDADESNCDVIDYVVCGENKVFEYQIMPYQIKKHGIYLISIDCDDFSAFEAHKTISLEYVEH